jgi:outer membrane protein assembly factor BamB
MGEKPHRVQLQVNYPWTIKSVRVLLYLDDLKYEWADVNLTENTSALCVTVAACSSLGIELNYSVSQYGAYITSLFGMEAPLDFSWWWELLLWNQTINLWQEAPKGASDLWLSGYGYESICWCPNTSAPPVQSRIGWSTWASFRGDPTNSGFSVEHSPKRNIGFYGKDFGNGPIDSTPVYADAKFFVSTGGVYNWSTMKYDKPPHLFSYNEGSSNWLNWSAETTAAGWQVSSPAVRNGRVYIGTSDGKVMAFSENNGSRLWTFDTGPSATGVTSSPVALSSGIYVAAGDGLLYAMSADGNVMWNFSLGGPAYMTTPAASGNRLYAGSDAGVISCIAQNGTQIWNRSLDGKIRASPAVANDTLVVVSTVYDGWLAIRSTVTALSTGTGAQLWNASIDASTSSPAIGDGRIFVGTNSGIVAFGLNGVRLWSHPAPGPVQSSPVYCENTLYYCTNIQNGTVYCLDVGAAPKELWNYTPEPRQYLFSSPIIVNSDLYFCSDNGILYSGGSPYGPLINFTVEMPERCRESQDALVRVNLTNIGEFPAYNVNVTLYVDPDDDDWSSERWILNPLIIARLDPGQNASVLFNATLGPGKHELDVEVYGNPVANSYPYGRGYVLIEKLPEQEQVPLEPVYLSILIFVLGISIVFLMLSKRPGRRSDAEK